MGFRDELAWRMFGHPSGVLGVLGGKLMARTKNDVVEWVIVLLDSRPNDRVLEVGFGPGVGIQHAAAAVPDGFVAGIDDSKAMVKLAHKRNASAVRTGRAKLKYGSAVDLPHDDDSFDGAFSVNSMQVWPDAVTGLRELRRVVKPGGRVVLAFTPHARQSRDELPDLLESAGFERFDIEERESAVCALADVCR